MACRRALVCQSVMFKAYCELLETRIGENLNSILSSEDLIFQKFYRHPTIEMKYIEWRTSKITIEIDVA
jgi:hypothetical protein